MIPEIFPHDGTDNDTPAAVCSGVSGVVDDEGALVGEACELVGVMFPGRDPEWEEPVPEPEEPEPDVLLAFPLSFSL